MGESVPSRVQELSERAGDEAQRAVRAAHPWIERLGRWGYIAKGAVYLVVGTLAAQAAIGSGGATTDPRGALRWVVQEPLGRVLLGAIAVGLVGYALWRFVQAAFDSEGKGADPKGLLARGTYAVIGAIYAGLALFAVRLTLGAAGDDPGGGGSTQDWTAWLMAQPLGHWLVGLIGAGVIGVGVAQLVVAYSASFRRKLRLPEMTDAQATWAVRIGRLGFAARGIAFGIIGGFLVVAAVRSQPAEARGLGGALATLAEQPFGPWLLGAVGVGLISHGLFALVQARYRRMLPSS